MSNSTAFLSSVNELTNAIDSLWIMVAGILVFFMQAGFAMLEVGTVRSKNAQNILLKNLLDVCLGTMLWWWFGYGFAYGESSNEFIGADQFAGNNFSLNSYRDWFFQWAFAATAATIVSGALAERTQFLAYSVFSCIITTWIYPVVVYWTWGGGWLADGGYLDFAGSGIVHLVGGMAALCGAAIVGPRKGRFDENREQEFKPHNMPLVVLGTFVLWFGWYGFNSGSTLGFTGDNIVSAALVAMNTSIAAATGGLVVLFFRAMLSRFGPKHLVFYDVVSMANGILAGLVSITAGCANVEPYAAFVIGLIGGLVYIGFSLLVEYFKVDDPLDAFAVHGGAGSWGVLALGLFHTELGAFYGAGGELFSWQLAGVLAIAVWSTVWSIIVFGLLKYFGKLRISAEEEEAGMDNFEHGGAAYHIEREQELTRRDTTA